MPTARRKRAEWTEADRSSDALVGRRYERPNSFRASSPTTIGRFAVRHAICAFSATEIVVTMDSWTGVSASAFCEACSNHPTGPVSMAVGHSSRRSQTGQPRLATSPAKSCACDRAICRLQPPGHCRCPSFHGTGEAPSSGMSSSTHFGVCELVSRRVGRLKRTIAELGPGSVFFVDTFEAARRPVLALEAAKGRPADTP